MEAASSPAPLSACTQLIFTPTMPSSTGVPFKVPNQPRRRQARTQDDGHAEATGEIRTRIPCSVLNRLVFPIVQALHIGIDSVKVLRLPVLL
jgi:hypothetical protein